MERTGDMYIKLISWEELPKLFGRQNYDLVNVILDHANSNGFFEVIMKHYNLEERVRWRPTDPDCWKFGADLFEAWVGAHIHERKLYDYDDPLRELRSFLIRLWSVRYRELRVFSYIPAASSAYILRGHVQEVHSIRVNCS